MGIRIRFDEPLQIIVSVPAGAVVASVCIERTSPGAGPVLIAEADKSGRAMLEPELLVELDRILVRCAFTHVAAGAFTVSVVLEQPGSIVASQQIELIANERGEANGEVQFEFSAPLEHLGSRSNLEFLAKETTNHADRIYPVWYATTRRPTDPTDPARGFGWERDDRVHYGACNVLVPKSHRIGSIGSSLWRRIITGQDDRMRLIDIQGYPADLYWNAVAARIGAADPAERHALVFVHGFNVTFEEAAVRAAQIGCDLGIGEGAMAFFSWPSRGKVSPTGYLADAASIDASERAIGDYLVDFARRSGASTVHVIAHSMGNRGILRAVAAIAADAERRSGVRFGQFMLAAADVDSDVFSELCAAYNELADRTTLYVSSRDRAVEASRWIHDFPRVGLTPPVTVAAGIDTISVSNTDLTMLGHSYVGDARDVLIDMHDLIQNNTPPENRFAMVRDVGGRYWHLSA